MNRYLAIRRPAVPLTCVFVLAAIYDSQSVSLKNLKILPTILKEEEKIDPRYLVTRKQQ